MDLRQALAFIVTYKISKKQKVKKKGVLGEEEMGGLTKSIRSFFHTRGAIH